MSNSGHVLNMRVLGSSSDNSGSCSRGDGVDDEVPPSRVHDLSDESGRYKLDWQAGRAYQYVT
jgi:hypothetical protein